MKKIYLIRHTKVDVPPKHFYGRTDVPLADSFLQEAGRIRSLLPSELEIPVWSSPLSRCRRLAEELFPKFEMDERLLELDFGDWEMKSWEEVPAAERDHYLANFDTLRPPNGEGFGDLQARSVSLFEEILDLEAPASAIVAHSGVIRALLCHVMQMPLSHLYRFDLSYGSVSSLIKDRKSLRVHQMNI